MSQELAPFAKFILQFTDKYTAQQLTDWLAGKFRDETLAEWMGLYSSYQYAPLVDDIKAKTAQPTTPTEPQPKSTPMSFEQYVMSIASDRFDAKKIEMFDNGLLGSVVLARWERYYSQGNLDAIKQEQDSWDGHNAEQLGWGKWGSYDESARMYQLEVDQIESRITFLADQLNRIQSDPTNPDNNPIAIASIKDDIRTFGSSLDSYRQLLAKAQARIPET